MINIMKFIKEQKTPRLKNKKSSVRVTLLSAMLLLLSSCGEPIFGLPECIEADSWGEKENITFDVPANKPLTPVGIRVAAGEPLEVTVSGVVNLCPDDTIIDNINPSIKQWQTMPGLEVEQGENFSIQVRGSYTDRRGQQRNGRGLYVYIAKEGEVPNNSDWWFGEEGGVAAENQNIDIRHAKAEGLGAKSPRFFELKDNGTTGKGGSGFYGVSPVKGKIWFKYARTAVREGDDTGGNKYGIDRSGSQRYSPWRGYYAWEDQTKCDVCSQATIMGTCTGVAVAAGAAAAAISFGIGGPAAAAAALTACITSWEVGCAATGHIEQGTYQRSGAGRHCREHGYPLSVDNVSDVNGNDHWVNDAYVGVKNTNQYDPARSSADNSGGYEIRIGNGCLGRYGKYLEMQIGESQITLEDKTIPEGCKVTQGDPSCVYATDDWNEQIIQTPVYSLAAGSKTSMDLRCAEDDGTPINGCRNEPYIEAGKFKGTVPASGELWFKVKDTVSSLTHPEPGYYADNTGEYNVNVVTTKVNNEFSDALDSFIKPMRGIIFGYCRVLDNKDTPEINEAGLGKYSITEENCGDAWLPGVTTRLYNKLIGGTIDPATGAVVGNPFLDAIRAALILYVIVYAGMFMVGMVEMSQQVFLHKVIKFGIVATLLSPGSWAFFYEYLFVFFINGVDNFIAILSNEFAGVVSSSVLTDPITGEVVKDAAGNEIVAQSATNIFRFADMTMSQFFNWASFGKTLGLLFASPLGLFYVIIIFIGFFTYAFSIVKAMMVYIIAMLAVSLLLIVAPIFISLMLFDKTKDYFDSWVKNLINYTFQPVLVFTALAIFNVFVYTFLYEMLNYRVCWDTIISLTVDIPTPIEGLKIPTFDISFLGFYVPDGVSSVLNVNDNWLSNNFSNSKMPVTFAMIISFIIVCHAMVKFIDWMADLASQLTTGQRNSVVDAAKSSMNNTPNALRAMWGGIKGGKEGGAKGGKAGAAMGSAKGARKGLGGRK